jgi:hypothetical protein
MQRHGCKETHPTYATRKYAKKALQWTFCEAYLANETQTDVRKTHVKGVEPLHLLLDRVRPLLLSQKAVRQRRVPVFKSAFAVSFKSVFCRVFSKAPK